MDGVHLPQGYSHSEEAVYFLPLGSQKFLVLILSTSEGWRYNAFSFKRPLHKVKVAAFGSTSKFYQRNPSPPSKESSTIWNFTTV